MAEEHPARPPGSFWIISGVALLWNLLGAATYLMYVKLDETALAALPESERMLYENTPEWVTAAYGIAVTAGVLGSLFLLLRKSWALPLLAVSLLAILAQSIHTLFLSEAVSVTGAQALVMPVLLIVIGAFLVWYAQRAGERGWIS